MLSPDAVEEVDVAVVGAGVTGCHVAWRLRTDTRPALDVALYEASSRIGGRLWSVRLPQQSQANCELGGMRFTERERVVTDLIAHLGLAAKVTDFAFDRLENLVHVRGHLLRRADLAAAPLPYALRPEERGRLPAALIAVVTERAVAGFRALRWMYHDAFRAAAWAEAEQASECYHRRKRKATVAGVSLHDVSWGALLRSVLSDEAVAFVQDADGYECVVSNGSAAGWLDNVFYTPDDLRSWRLEGGFEQLPQALHARFRAAGGRTQSGHRLLRLDRCADAAGAAYRLELERAGGRAIVRARAVVLAMPRRSLELLDQNGFLFREGTLSRYLASVAMVPAFKLFLAYPSAWWTRTGVSRGRSTTDLPLRQLYYLDSSAVVMAAYASGPDAEQWSAPGGAAPATREMMERAHLMLLEVHGVAEAPHPICGCFASWGADPFGGGWPVWAPGSVADQIIPTMRRPIAGEQVFVVGDCWSHAPGSVDGALSTAECLLQDELGLAWPGWLRREGTRLGPRRARSGQG